jgi:hypothetical protein
MLFYRDKKVVRCLCALRAPLADEENQRVKLVNVSALSVTGLLIERSVALLRLSMNQSLPILVRPESTVVNKSYD